MNDLDISQQGEDTEIIYGPSSRIYLTDYDAGLLLDDYFIFSTTGMTEFLVV